MKTVLITGANSYIGDSVAEFLRGFPDEYTVLVKSTFDWTPNPTDFKDVDVVFNVAGIAHIRENNHNRDLYYKVNRDLSISIAKAAKEAGVKQLILLSTMSVYGVLTGHITKDSKPNPVNSYGKSKLQADIVIERLSKDSKGGFKFCCLRPPMIYGNGCKGNYQSLRNFALWSPVFPDCQNQRSMLYIGNLCWFVKDCIDRERQGLFFPQNSEYVRTSEMVKTIAEINDKKIGITKVFNPAILMMGRFNVIKKVFGTLTYEKSDLVNKFDFKQSIRITERPTRIINNSLTSNKKILVMMSTYNGEKHIKEQIESILHQTVNHDIHLRIRDDGSTDKTCEIIDGYIAKYPKQIELIKGNNVGYNASFFELINSAEGYDYYSISDQDDVWLADKLQIACDAIDDVGEDIPVLYASTSYLVHDDLIPYGTTRIKKREMSIYNTIIQNICPGHTQVMNGRLLNLIKNDDINPGRIYVYDSWIQNVANLYGKIVFDNEPHTYYRQYEGNQLGSGVGKLGQLLASIRRDKTGDGHKYRRQIAYFIEVYGDMLRRRNFYDNIFKFSNSVSVIARIKYVLFSRKVYRQRRIESVVFYVAVLLGKY